MIGGVVFDSPFLLAPLAGVSDSPFRQLAREQGASGVYTEMVSADGLARGNQATVDYCRFEAIERPIGIQLFGSDPAVMAEATRVLCDFPAEQRPDLLHDSLAQRAERTRRLEDDVAAGDHGAHGLRSGGGERFLQVGHLDEPAPADVDRTKKRHVRHDDVLGSA